MFNKFRFFILMSIFIPIFAVFFSCSSNNNDIISRWVQYGPSGIMTARVITDQGNARRLIFIITL